MLIVQVKTFQIVFLHIQLHPLHRPVTNFCISRMKWPTPYPLLLGICSPANHCSKGQSSCCSKWYGTRYFRQPFRHSCRNEARSIYPSVCPSVRPSIRSQLRGNKVAGGPSHLSVNWTSCSCSMQIRSIDWNTDWVVYFTPNCVFLHFFSLL